MNPSDALRHLPSVDEVWSRLGHLNGQYPRQLVVDEIRRVIGSVRAEILRGSGSELPDICACVQRNLEILQEPSLRDVINATGVILHTNLGRAPLVRFTPEFGYTNLEYDIAKGHRGKRDVHVSGLLERLCGVPGIAVNNNAAAVYLALNELAKGYEVVVSRGELIEIGDGFRIPDIMQQSGAILREVGTTNRTRIEDYKDAINERTRLLMRVHPSNFVIRGFSARPDISELVALGRERGIPVYEDLGSGCVTDLRRYGIREPLVQHVIEAGVNLVSFSGDKLLGGPQAGLLAGDPVIVSRLRRNAMFRALRVDKLIYQALERTLRMLVLQRWEDVPILRMISLTKDEMRRRSEDFVRSLGDVRAEIVCGESMIGGGSTPEQPLETWVIAIEAADAAGAERRCRMHNPPVIARIENERLIVDLRTVFPEQETALAEGIREACRCKQQNR